MSGDNQTVIAKEISDFNDFKTILVQVERIAQASPEKKILVIFDMDDNLFTYNHAVGSDIWFTEEFNKLKADGLTIPEIKEQLIPQLKLVSKNATDYRLVQDNIPEILEKIQALPQVESFILTSRNIGLRGETERQLKDLNINFNKGLGFNKFFHFHDKSRFLRGVAYTDGAHKGDALKALLKALNYQPDVVIFSDDKQYNVERVGDALDPEIDYYGFRCGIMDEDNEKYNEAIAAMQLKYLANPPTILSNEAAAALHKVEHGKEKNEIEFQKDCLVGRTEDALNTLKTLLGTDYKNENLENGYFAMNGKEKKKLCWQYPVTSQKFEALKPQLKEQGLMPRVKP